MSKINFAWDSGVFIAWFCEESDKPLSDISFVVEMIDKKEANLIVPVTVFSELLETKFTDKQWEKFEAWMQRPNLIPIATTMSIARKCAGIRVKMAKVKPQAMAIKQPDGIIVATAILAGATVLHTFDEKLLRLSGTDFVDGLRIQKPMDPRGQKSLIE